MCLQSVFWAGELWSARVCLNRSTKSCLLPENICSTIKQMDIYAFSKKLIVISLDYSPVEGNWLYLIVLLTHQVFGNSPDQYHSPHSLGSFPFPVFSLFISDFTFLHLCGWCVFLVELILPAVPDVDSCSQPLLLPVLFYPPRFLRHSFTSWIVGYRLLFSVYICIFLLLEYHLWCEVCTSLSLVFATPPNLVSSADIVSSEAVSYLELKWILVEIWS